MKEVLRETGGRGVDVTFDCATQDDTVNQALYMTAPAAPSPASRHRVALDFHHMRARLRFFSVRRANHTGDACPLLEKHPRAFTPMITHTFRWPT